MVVDSATNEVFVSSGTANSVTVLNMSGQIVTTILGEAGAAGMTLVGSNLYVMDTTAGAIDVISTSTLTRTTTLATGIIQAKDIVAAGGLLWVDDNGHLASISPTTGTVTTSNVNGTPLLEQDPADTNTFFGAVPEDSPGTVCRWTVSSDGAVTEDASESFFTTPVISNIQDLAVSPDGTHVVPAAGAPYSFYELNSSDFSQSGVVYPANPYPSAVAMTGANGGLFAGGMNGIYDPDVVVYGLDNPSDSILSYDFGPTYETTLPQGLAFSPNGAELFDVTGGDGSDLFHVFTLSGTPLLQQWAAASTTTVQPTQAPGNGTNTVSVDVTLSDGTGDPLTDKTVSLSLTGAARVMGEPTETTDSTGSASFNVADPDGETVTVTATDDTDGFTVLEQPTVEFTTDPADSSQSSLSFDPETTAAGNVAVGQLTLEDAAGAPISGRVVSLAVSGSARLAPPGYQGGTTDQGFVTDANGKLSFSVTDAVAEPVAVTATDGSGTSLSATIRFTPSVRLTNPGNQSNTTGTPVSLSFKATDLSYPITRWTASGLPSGLSIDPTTGLISGTPTTAGVFDTSVTATDAAGFTGSAAFTWQVTNVVTVPTPGPQTSEMAFPITPLPLSVTDSSPVASISWTASGLPPGLSISASGVVTGTPTTPGVYDVFATATDSASYSNGSWFVWTITSPVAPTNPGPQSSFGGAAVKLQLAGSDADGSTISQWGATGLPPGLTISSSTGLITGSPTTLGSFSPIVTATDALGLSSPETFTWTIANPVSVVEPGPQSSQSGTKVSLQVTASDAVPTSSIVSYAATGLPPGLAISPEAGIISGTPTTGGAFIVAITATDSNGFSTTTPTFRWIVYNAVTITQPGPEQVTIGQPVALAMTGADSSNLVDLSWSATGLPAGLGIDPGGLIAGVPTVAGSSTSRITATDSAGFFGSIMVSWTVGKLSVSAPATETSWVGHPVSVVLQSYDTSGAPVVFSATGLPAGLELSSSTGLITGTPTKVQSARVEVTVRQASHRAKAMIRWTVGQPITITPQAPLTSALHQSVTIQIEASDLAGSSLTYSATGLPSGVTIDPTSGLISGAPTTGGHYTATVTVSDGSTQRSTSFKWTVQ